MAVRGEEVASSIDAQVRESIEKMVAEIRSSVEDVRVLVDQQLKAALQSVQADVNSFTFLPQIKKSIGELEEQIEAARPAAAAPTGSGASRVKAAVQSIERGRSQVDVLNSLLEQSLEFGSRAALLILRGETFSGWKGVGFSAQGGNDEMVKRFNAAPGLIPELDRVLREERVVAWDGANLSTRLGVPASETAVLVPMVIKDKVSAAVYVDAVGEGTAKFDQAAIELLVFTTGLLVDTLAIRKKIPSPSLSGDAQPAAYDRTTTSGPAFAAAPVAAAPAPPAPAPAPAAPAPAPAPAPAAAAAASLADQPVPMRTDAGTVAINAAQLREMMAAQRPNFNVPSAEDFGVSGSGQQRVPPVAAPAPAPAPPPAAPEPPKPAPPAAAAATPSLGGDDRPSTQYIPPPNLAKGPAAGPPTEDSKKHDEARRFARLLVSEIKLYNESKVEQGRKNHDLYERLKEDIDRSRQMYDERISDEVRKVSNYFYDELVRILADGRSDALGL
ncbi:MAG TPA: hypothetical protein VFV49_12990 [Thermoanaerobaculia bacterium]|nr:hypothetical protein [Thermoanaerobaculia bacterium]